MNFLKIIRKQLFMLYFILAGLNQAVAQTPNITPWVEQGAYGIREEVSLTNPLSNQIFTYTTFFKAADGTSDLKIKTFIKEPLEIVSIIYPPSYSGNVPQIFTSATAGGTFVNLVFPTPVSGNIAGDFQVNVRFPIEQACDSLAVHSYAELSAGFGTVNLMTDRLYSYCRVNNFWHIQKFPTPSQVTYLGGTCDYGFTPAGNQVEYTLKVVKNNSVLNGSHILSSVSIQDYLAGGTVVPGTFSAFILGSPNTPIAGASIDNAGMITFPSGFMLHPSNGVYQFKFKIEYPGGIPSNTCITNIAELKGFDPCNTQYTYRDTTSITRVPPGEGELYLNKKVDVTGNVPGCTGTYTITIKNTTGAPITYFLTDEFPSCLNNVQSSQVPANGQATLNGAIWEMSNPNVQLGVNQTHVYKFTFEIGNSCPTNVINTVNALQPIAASHSATFKMLPAGAVPCITKTRCETGTYSLGDLVRFRIRVQNIGNTPITGSNISDVLDPLNFEYIGNEIYYVNPTATVACGNGSIPAGATAWNNVIPNHTISSNSATLNWSLPEIPVVCAKVNNPVCGSAGNLPAYFIEFTVKIKDTAAIGNIRNIAVISGGNVTTPVQSTSAIVVNGNTNYSLDKLVSADGQNFSHQATVNPGDIVAYNLKINNLGIGIVNPVIVDLLPKDNANTDNFILVNNQRSPAGTIDIRFNTFISSNYSYINPMSSTATGINTNPELGITVNTGAAGWGAGFNNGSANFKASLTQTVTNQLPAEFVFDAKVGTNALPSEYACNTFAIRGRMKRYHNYTLQLPLLAALESVMSCVNISKDTVPCCKPTDFIVPQEICIGETVQFCAVDDDCSDEDIQYVWDFGDGSPVAYGKCVSHIFTSPGVYSVVVKWRNKCGDEDFKKFEVRVERCVCKIDVTYKVSVTGLNVVADASTTSVSGGQIAAYIWNMGDGTTLMGQIVSHQYATPGSYEVTLVVYALDSNGEICECVDKCKRKIEAVKDDSYTKVYKCPEIVNFKTAATIPETSANQLIMMATPNPFVDKLTVTFNLLEKKQFEKGSFKLEFVTSSGKILQRKELQHLNQPVSIDTRNYAAGLYFIILKNEKGSIQSKQVVKLN